MSIQLSRGSAPSGQAAFLNEAMRRLTEKISSKAVAQEAFRKIDRDGSGELDTLDTKDTKEFKQFLNQLHLQLNDRQVAAIMDHLDKDGDGTISIAEFMDVVWQRKLKTLSSKFQAASYSLGGIDLDKLFRHYDRDNSGELDFQEFRQAVRKDVKMKSSDVTDGELREVFDHVDSDKGGTIGLEEFKSLMGIATCEEDHRRHDSMSGHVFLKILERSEEKRMNVLSLFHQFDPDDSGGLEKGEFVEAMRSLGLDLSEEEVQQVLDELDSDGDGVITTKEFADRMRRAKRDKRASDESRGAGPGQLAARIAEGLRRSDTASEPEPEPETAISRVAHHAMIAGLAAVACVKAHEVAKAVSAVVACELTPLTRQSTTEKVEELQSKGFVVKRDEKREYTLGREMSVSEDLHHEFKDVNQASAKEMVAKYVTGFLNTGRGGTLFFGVHDSGQVIGTRFSKHGKDSIDEFMLAVARSLHPSRIIGPPIQDHVHFKINFEVVFEDTAGPTCVVEVVVSPREQLPEASQAKAWLVAAKQGQYFYYRRDLATVQQFGPFTKDTADRICETGDYTDAPVAKPPAHGKGKSKGKSSGGHHGGAKPAPAPAPVVQSYRCDVCEMDCGGPTQLDGHLAGKKHAKKVRANELSAKAKGGANQAAYHCPDCRQQFATWGHCLQHLKAANHAGAANSMRGLRQRCAGGGLAQPPQLSALRAAPEPEPEPEPELEPEPVQAVVLSEAEADTVVVSAGKAAEAAAVAE